uniref:Aminotransferase-like plant mobile domain-containing protein n=1 Tax=Fagus sylvatica TaxID=28930 RepID=A0A2N9EUF0_FAGSY
MASSSRRPTRGRGGTSSGKGGPSVAGGMAARGSEDNSDGSDSVLGSPENKSCHTVATAFNTSVVHSFLWEHALEYITKGRKPYEGRNKFANMPKEVAAHVGNFQGDILAIFRWVGWMSGFRDIEVQDYTLIAEDFTAYCAHRVKRQFGFDQEVPAVMGIVASEIPTINPFLKTRAFAYWSSVAPRVVISSGNRVGIYTSAMSNYWGDLMAEMVEFKNSGRGDISHLLQARASKKKRTSAARAGRRVLILETAVKSPLPMKESVVQRVSAPIIKKPIRKTRAGKRTFVPPAFSIVSTSIALRKSTRNIVYSEKRSKQRVDTLNRVPIVIPDDLNSSSSSGDETDLSEAVIERVRGEEAGIDAAGAVSEEETAAAEDVSPDEATASDASSEEEIAVAKDNTDEDAVSMDELEAIEASFDDVSTASTSNPKSIERAVEEHVVVEGVTSAVRDAKSTPVTITSSGETAQGNPSRSGSHTDPTLFDSSPSTLHYVRRAQRGSMVSTNSERTISATARAPTPPSPLQESGVVPGSEEVFVHISNVPEGNIVGDAPTNEDIVVNTDLGTGVTQIGHGEAATSADPALAGATLSSDIPAMEGTFAQDPADDVFMENMADTHDSYDDVLARTGEHVADAQAIYLEVTTSAAAHVSPTRSAGSGNEAVAEEERRHQAAAVESAIRGQPGLLSAARFATLGSSILADMDAFFRESDRMLVSSRHAKHFWVFDDAKADFEGFRVPSMLTRLCCVLAHMEHTRLEDVTEFHILEWKAVVQEITREGFKFSFILDYLWRLAHDMFSRRILAKLRVVEA